MVEAEIEQVCGSAQFRKAPAQSALLRYLWEHRHEPVSEYAIGVDALGRKPDFDPKVDSTVRVQISRLRQRLKDYYETEGREQTTRLHIPMGEYRVETLIIASPEVPAPPSPPPPKPNRKLPWMLLAMAGVALLLLGDNLRLRWQATPRPAPLPPFWAAVAKAGQPVPIIVPAPIFFRWENQPYVVRDFGVNHSTEFERSPFLKPLGKQFGTPQITQLYTVASDTRAASTVAKYLQDRGVPAEVIDTPTATLDILASQSTIIFAGPGTTSQLGPLLSGMNFYVEPGRGGVLNRNPLDKEPPHFTEVRHSPLRATNYGIIARLPGQTPGTVSLVFLSSFNPALLSMTVNAGELGRLTSFLKTRKEAPYFETVVRFERNADRVLQTEAVAYRPVTR